MNLRAFPNVTGQKNHSDLHSSGCHMLQSAKLRSLLSLHSKSFKSPKRPFTQLQIWRNRMASSTSKQPNRLAKEKSPYLLQHQYNPVDWYVTLDIALDLEKAKFAKEFLVEPSTVFLRFHDLLYD